MNELQLRIQVQGAVQQYVEQLLYQNGVPAHVIEDAFSKSLGYIREKSMQEFLEAAMTPSVPEKKEEVAQDGDDEESCN